MIELWGWVLDRPAIPGFFAAIAAIGALWIAVLQRSKAIKIERSRFIHDFNKVFFDFEDVSELILNKTVAVDLLPSQLVRIRNYAILFESVEHNVKNGIITYPEFQTRFGARFEEFWDFILARQDLQSRPEFRDVMDGLEFLRVFSKRAKPNG